jgi:hypothetical protein
MANTITDEQFDIFCTDADLKTPERAARDLRRMGFPEGVVDQLVERYETHVGVIRSLDSPHYMASHGRTPWYTGPRPKDPCWPKLVALLHQQGFSDANLAKLNESSNRIVGLLEHPARNEFRTKGLVLGHVQSGKTTNFTSVAAKAVDRGYRLVIVLAGVHNELRRQTQQRLIDQLIKPNPELWQQLTRPEHDFHPKENAPAYFSQYSTQKVLCVVKKNGFVLRKLIEWLGEASDQLIKVPALIIDDEADQAAVATKTINPLIRELLDVLPKVGYVGYTATPFANLLIDPSAEDLYPRDFIVDLPQPEGHFGTSRIFGREPEDDEDAGNYDDESLDVVRRVPDEEVPFVRPLMKADIPGFVPAVQGTLKQALQYFWLATASRRARWTGNPHSTMLIHTSVSVSVHESFHAPIETLRQDLLRRVKGGDATLIGEFRELWERETARVPAESVEETGTTFDELYPELETVLAASQTILDNSRSEQRLDYTGEPVIAVAIGGNTLSRGLTLEGLVVSYFVRSATAYDTLLQMGRWFGYRGGYADLPRIWMTEELEQWFTHLAEIEQEIRRDIDRYMQDGETPETFAVRIRKHPSLAITAAAKMQDAVEVAGAFGGLRVQTRYFEVDDHDWLVQNQQAARDLVSRLATGPAVAQTAEKVWFEVSSEAILDFLDAYAVHDYAPDNSTEFLAKYVRARNKKGLLKSWNVALIGSTTADVGTFDFGPGLSVPKVVRSRRKTPGPADIKTLMSRRDAAVDLEVPHGGLSEGQIRTLRAEQMLDTPLLALYAIDRVSKPLERFANERTALDALEDVIGLGIVFPTVKPEDDEAVYVSADLSRLQPKQIGDVEQEDETLLEDEQL